MNSLRDIQELLTPKEFAFVLAVYQRPGCKLNEEAWAWDDDDETSIPLWKNPEHLGLIRSIGSYKWEPVNLIVKLFAPVHTNEK